MPLELPEGWREQLPENIRENGALDGLETIDKMAEMIVNGRALQSNSIHIPSDSAGPEKREAFLKDLQEKVPDLVYVGEGADMGNIYDRMGRPGDPSGYEIGDVPDPIKETMGGLAEKAHELGITKGQMKGLSETIISDFDANRAKSEEAIDAVLSEVKKEYGEAYEDSLKGYADFAESIGFDDHLVDAIGTGKVGLRNLRALEKLKLGFNSPGPKIGDDFGNNSPLKLTPAMALKKREEIFNNKKHPYWDGSSPEHKNAVMEVVELTRAVEAGKEPDENERFRDALLGRS